MFLMNESVLMDKDSEADSSEYGCKFETIKHAKFPIFSRIQS